MRIHGLDKKLTGLELDARAGGNHDGCTCLRIACGTRVLRDRFQGAEPRESQLLFSCQALGCRLYVSLYESPHIRLIQTGFCD